MVARERNTGVCSAIAIAVVACLFVVRYSSLEANNARWLSIELPLLTRLMADGSAWGFGIPVLLAAVYLIRRDSQLLALIVSGIAAIFALAWMLLCLYAWRMPYEIIGTQAV